MFKHKTDEEKRLAHQAGEERNRLFNEKLAKERQVKADRRRPIREKRNADREARLEKLRPITDKLASDRQALVDRKEQFTGDLSLARQSKDERKLQKKLGKSIAEEVKLERFGRLLLKETPGSKKICFYSKGYVSISGLFSAEQTPVKLLGVSLRSNLSKKTGLGRAVGAAATGGMNLVLAGSARGDVYLTITTSERVHVIHVDGVHSPDLKSFVRVEAMALSLLSNPEAFDE